MPPISRQQQQQQQGEGAGDDLHGLLNKLRARRLAGPDMGLEFVTGSGRRLPIPAVYQEAGNEAMCTDVRLRRAPAAGSRMMHARSSGLQSADVTVHAKSTYSKYLSAGVIGVSEAVAAERVHSWLSKLSPYEGEAPPPEEEPEMDRAEGSHTSSVLDSATHFQNTQDKGTQVLDNVEQPCPRRITLNGANMAYAPCPPDHPEHVPRWKSMNGENLKHAMSLEYSEEQGDEQDGEPHAALHDAVGAGTEPHRPEILGVAEPPGHAG